MMKTDDDYEPSYPGPEERLEQILEALERGDKNAVLDVINEIFDDGYQEGCEDIETEWKGTLW